jgi:hypothetical protein
MFFCFVFFVYLFVVWLFIVFILSSLTIRKVPLLTKSLESLLSSAIYSLE